MPRYLNDKDARRERDWQERRDLEPLKRPRPMDEDVKKIVWGATVVVFFGLVISVPFVCNPSPDYESMKQEQYRREYHEQEAEKARQIKEAVDRAVIAAEEKEKAKRGGR
jgi:hypothetical protein